VLLLAGKEHHDGLMREFRLLALHGSIGPTDAPVRFMQLVGILGAQYASARARRDEEIEAAIRRGETSIDQVALVPPTAAASLSAFQDLMDEADDFCRASLLIAVPRPPLLREFSHWYLGQFADQLAGHPPRALGGAPAPITNRHPISQSRHAERAGGELLVRLGGRTGLGPRASKDSMSSRGRGTEKR